MNSYRKQLIERIANQPGVLSIAFSSLPVPAREEGWKDTVSSMTADSNSAGGPVTILAVVSPGFFKTLGISLISGRDFDWTDDEKHSPVAIIDSNLARRLGPPEDRTLKPIRFGVQPEFQNLVIAGVVRSARIVDLRDADMPVLYVPYLQHPNFSRRGNLLAKQLIPWHSRNR